jgi:hypothetical protein
MKHLLSGIFMVLLPLWASAAELTDRTELEFRGQTLMVFQGECSDGHFTVQRHSTGFQFIGPEGTGLATTPEQAAQQACGENRVKGL